MPDARPTGAARPTSGEATPDVAPPLGGGRYRLVEAIGEGGMSRVYLALDTHLGAHRVVKELHPRLASDPAARARFANEARALAMLHHPDVVVLHDLVEEGDRLAMVLEHLPGGNLEDEAVRRGGLPVGEAAEAVRATLRALQAAHGKGIVHRDVKPSNILRTADGRPRLADFGIARLETANRLTVTGSTMGTFGYIAPEQLDDPRHLDPRADIYGAGATLAGLLTGRVPHALRDSDRRAALLAELPACLRSVVDRATRSDPAERYPDARTMLEALDVAVAAASGASSVREPGAAGGASPVPPAGTAPGEPPPAPSASPEGDPPTGRAPRPLPALLVLLGVVVLVFTLRHLHGTRAPATGSTPGPADAGPPASRSAPGAAATGPPTPPPPAPPDPTPEAPAGEPEGPDAGEVGPSSGTGAGKPTPRSPALRPEAGAAAATGRQPDAPRRTAAGRTAAAGSDAAGDDGTGEAPDEPGRLTINSIPWSPEVAVDGQVRGATPLTLELAPGRHAVRLRTADGREQAFEIVVGPGEHLRSCWSFRDDGPCR